MKTGNNIVPACYPALRLNGNADANANANAEDNIDASPHRKNTHRSQTKNLPILPHSISSPIRHLTDGHNTIGSAKEHANNSFGANGRLTAIHDHYDSAGLNTGCCNEATFVVINHTVMRWLDIVSIPMPVPCNGPSEGEPQYPVPCNVYERFIQEIEDTNEGKMGSSPPMDHLLNVAMPRPSPMPRALPISMPMPQFPSLNSTLNSMLIPVTLRGNKPSGKAIIFRK